GKTVKLDTVIGTAYMQKTDILKRLTWFSYEDKPSWICVPLDTVNEYLELNEKGKKAPELIEEFEEMESTSPGEINSASQNDLASDDITRLDKKRKPKKKKKKPEHQAKSHQSESTDK